MKVQLLPDEEYDKLRGLLDGSVVVVPRSAMDQFAAAYGLTTGEVMELTEDTDYGDWSEPNAVVDMAGYDHSHLFWFQMGKAIKEAK